MRLFGLKNEKGKEVELTMSSQMDEYGNLVRYFIGNISVINKEKPPQFKTGDWVRLKREGPLDNKGRIVNVNCIETGRVAVQIPEISENQRFHEKAEDLLLMTVDEISSHLKIICRKKGYKEGTRIKDMDNGHIKTLTRCDKWFYEPRGDMFLGCVPTDEWDDGHSNPAIYEQGKFAEIVPDKKKLPKTKEELKQFMLDYLRAPILERYDTLTEYLSKYED